VLVTLFSIGAAAGFVGAGVFRGRPCEGATFVSEAFGYCVDPPNGWLASSAKEELSGVDAFRDGDGSTVIYVEAVRLGGGVDLDAFASRMRALDADAGHELSDARAFELGGVPALGWDVRLEGPTGPMVVREIVTVAGAAGWRLQWAHPGLDPAADEEARSLLQSWRFS
jgi:hypothetical protein